MRLNTLKALTQSKARQYMEGWMELTSIKRQPIEAAQGVGRHAFIFTARSSLGYHEYAVNREADSEDQYDVYRRPLGSIDYYDWEWVDAINADKTE